VKMNLKSVGLLTLIFCSVILSLLLFKSPSTTPKFKIYDSPLVLKPNASYSPVTETLTLYVNVNCCGTKLEVSMNGRNYLIREKRVGDICRCFCTKKIEILDAKPLNVTFIDWGGRKTEIPVKLINNSFCGISTYGKCKTDSDCVVSGCSNEVCESRYEKPIFTSCIYKKCFDAKLYGMRCRCINGKCQWSR